ncbi:MAG: hypothetical protein KAS72_09370 [Phycisphaerales bacterium]|nr:hypothetical protein [Phycisphaerales bacterium]
MSVVCSPFETPDDVFARDKGDAARSLIDFELFRIDADISEERDVFAGEPDRVESLMRELIEMARSVNASCK